MDRSLYKRPEKPLFLTVTNRRELGRSISERLKTGAQEEKPLVVHADTECHVTPEDVAERMVGYAVEFGVCADDLWFEPSAGTGRILKEILSVAPDEKVTAIELNIDLSNYLQKTFASVSVIQMCCISYCRQALHGQGFDKIVMNPPFRRVVEHVKAAAGMLKAGGVLVALVPVSFQMNGFVELEKLPSTTFSNAKVNTKIVRYVK